MDQVNHNQIAEIEMKNVIDKIIGLQAHIRGNIVRQCLRERSIFFHNHIKEVIIIQVH